MQYKRIENALHNFGQSFMSGTNYFDNDHVMYDVQRIVMNHPDHEICINFNDGNVEPIEVRNEPRLKKSIEHYMQHLPQHLSSHNVDYSRLKNIVLRHVATNRGHRTYMHAIDDRGTEYEVFVNPA